MVKMIIIMVIIIVIKKCRSRSRAREHLVVLIFSKYLVKIKKM